MGSFSINNAKQHSAIGKSPRFVPMLAGLSVPNEETFTSSAPQKAPYFSAGMNAEDWPLDTIFYLR